MGCKHSKSNSNQTPRPTNDTNNGSRPFIHGLHRCDICLNKPIVGARWHATNPVDYNVCQSCKENLENSDISFEAEELDRDRSMQEIWARQFLGNKSQFQKWKEENETMQSNGKVETTLQQQIALASQLWDEAAGNTDTTVSAAAQTQDILEALQKTQVDDNESIVSWKGFHVGWFLDVFCKTPYMQKLLEFGCELWFVRKVCIVEIIRQAHCAMNKDVTDVPVLSGPFVNFMDTVVSGLGLEGDAGKIVKTPTTFISYTGGYTMQETLDMLHELGPSEIVWMDVFCVNQFAWTGKSRSPEMKQFKETFLGDLEKQIQTINNTVLVVADWENVMATLGQIWVLWEIFCTAEGGSWLNVVLPPAQAHDFVQNCLESDKNFDGIMRSLASIDANNARAEEGADEQVILARMLNVGLANVNNVASDAVREWLYQKGRGYLKERRKSHDGPSALLLKNLALLLRAQGKLDEAGFLFREALEEHQKVLGRDHPSTLASLNNLALLSKDQGKLGDAEPLYREALETQQKVLGRDHSSTLTSLNNLAGLLRAQGKLDEAGPLFREALETQRKVLGRDHPSTLVSLGNLAGLLQDQGKLGEAEPLYREVLERHQKVLGRDHPHTLASLNNLAGLLQDQGKFDEAEPLFWEALGKRQKVLGRDHPSTPSSLGNLAGLLRAQGKLDEAEPLFREALETQQKVLGRDHPDTLTSLNNLALLRRAQGKLDEAEPLFREALETQQKVLGRDHPSTLISLGNLAGLLHGQGKLGEAEVLYREVLETHRKVLGRDHPNTLTSLKNLALLLDDQGKLDEAEPLCQEALEQRQKLLGRDHPDTLVSMCNLALLLHHRGGSACLDESKVLLWECKTASLAKLGANHPDTIERCEHWGRLFGSAAEQQYSPA